jgi:hypothetical protein
MVMNFVSTNSSERYDIIYKLKKGLHDYNCLEVIVFL